MSRQNERDLRCENDRLKAEIRVLREQAFPTRRMTPVPKGAYSVTRTRELYWDNMRGCWKDAATGAIWLTQRDSDMLAARSDDKKIEMLHEQIRILNEMLDKAKTKASKPNLRREALMQAISAGGNLEENTRFIHAWLKNSAS